MDNVVTRSWDAEKGLACGAAVIVQIKNDTNALHGSAFEYHNDNAIGLLTRILSSTPRA